MKKQDQNKDLQKELKGKSNSKMEAAAELAQPSKKKADAHSSKPDVDPGIDYMRWSD